MTVMTGRHAEWMTIGDAAEYLGVTHQSIYRYMNQRRLTRYKYRAGTRTRLRRSEVVAFNTPRRVDGTET